MATKHIATWSHNLQYTSIPPPVIRAATQSFYNWFGCTIGGSGHAAATIAHESLRPFFGPETSSLLGTTLKTDAQHAALINGIASHVHDYDDTHLDTIIHPTGPVASALLAIAEKGSFSGKQFLSALIAGIEVECKLGLAVWPEHYDVGWHITSTTGSIGAAIAVSKLLNLSIDQTTHALGIASTQVTGLREQFGAHTKSFHPGRAAQNGLLAAILASNGYTASLSSIEAKRGWINVVGVTKDQTKLQQDTDKWLGIGDSKKEGLGLVTISDTTTTGGQEEGRWEILRNSFKPFPCGIVIHPIIDACSQLHRKSFSSTAAAVAPRESISKIKKVTARVHPLVLELTGKKTPKDGLEAKFSVYHGGAIGLLYGKGTPDQYVDSVVLSNEVIEVRDKIEAIADKDIRPDQCEIEVELDVVDDGETKTKILKQDVEHAVGSMEVPMTEDLLEEKFLGQVGGVIGREKALELSREVWGIEGWEDVAGSMKGLAEAGLI